MISKLTLGALAMAFSMAVRGAEAPSSETISIIAERYLAKMPIPLLEKGFSMDAALKSQSELVAVLSKDLGPVTGYKIGLITRHAQERMGATAPVCGMLLEKMLLPNHAKAPAHFGVRPLVEIDIGVVVNDPKINDATTAAEIASHLSHLVCFIEMVDTITATNQPMDAPLLTALNVGARAGILGQQRRMTPPLAEALPQMKLSMLDDSGQVLAETPALGLQPLENIPLLAAQLKKQGKALKKGDFISLGSPAPQVAAEEGKKLTLRYENIPGGALTATVSFTR